MNNASDTNTIQMDLLALCEGELDAAGMRRVEAFLKQHETAQKQATAQTDNPADATDTDGSTKSSSPAVTGDMNLAHIRAMLLKQRINRTMRTQTPKVSADLTSQISQMFAVGSAATAAQPALKLAGQTETASSTPHAAPVSRWLLASRWAPAGLAAMLLLGVVLMQWSQPRIDPNNIANTNNPTNLATGFGPNTASNSNTNNANTNASASAASQNRTGQPAQNRLSNSVFDSVAGLTDKSATYPVPAAYSLLTTSLQAPVAYAQLSTEKINAFGNRHSVCSKKLERLYRSSQFPVEVAKMPEAIAASLGKTPKGSLDLSQSGYKFSKAGECRIPGQPSVHLVYRTKTSDDAVSLWVVTYNGKPQLAQGTLYQGDPADSDHPIFFFRQDDLVYYLVGNAFDHTRVAAQELVVASR